MTESWSAALRSVRRGMAVRWPDQPAVLTLCSLVLCAMTLWVVLNTVLDPSRTIGPYGTSALLFWLVLAVAALPLALRGLARVGRVIDHGPRVPRILIPGSVLMTGFGVQLVIGYTTLREPGFDAHRIFHSAVDLAHGVEPEPEYFMEYPNNIFLLFGLSRYFAVIKDLGVQDADLLLGAVVLNAVFLTAGMWVTYLTARRLGGGTVAITSLVLAAPFVVVSPWIGTPYSDTLALVFPVLILATYLRARDAASARSRWPWWILTGIITAIGYSIKPTVIFATVAVVVVLLCAGIARRDGVRSMIEPFGVVATLGVVFIATLSSITWVEDAAGVVSFDIAGNEQAFPLTHFMKIGAKGEGGYSAEDVIATRAQPPQDRFGHGLDVYLDRVRDMGAGGYVDFLAGKQLRAFGDGSFYQWGEGEMLDFPFSHDDSLSLAVQEVYAPGGDQHGRLLLFWQVMWVMTLGLVAAPLVLRGRIVFGDPATVMRLAILGLMVFLMLFETRSRYVYLYVPYFAILAAISAGAVATALSSARRQTEPGRRALRDGDGGLVTSGDL